MRRMLISLFVIGIWLPSSATGGQIFSEVKRIFGLPSADGEGSLMRMRTCRDEFMVQCKPCEVIRIVNASYAATRQQQRNPIQGCSDVSFQHEFDCLHPAKKLYFEGIKRSCDGIQVCESRLDKDSVSCGSSWWTWSCCMEIYYTCKPKSELIQSVLFTANDLYGNVNDISLQCQSSDLSVDSAVLAFNSSGEVQDGGVCYKESLNTNNLKLRCAGRGCSGISVTGSRGCGRNEYVFNHGVYVCYICKGSKVSTKINVSPQYPTSGQTTIGQKIISNEADSNKRSSAIDIKQTSKPGQGVAATTTSSETIVSVIKTASSSTPESPQTRASSSTSASVTATTCSSISQSSTATSLITISKWFTQENLLVMFGASVVVIVLLLCLLICTKRSRNRELDSRHLGRIQLKKGAKHSRGSHTSEEEQEHYSYPEMSPICQQLNDAGKDQNNEVCNHADDAESGLQNENKHLNRVEIKEHSKTVCEVSLRVLYENPDKRKEIKYFETSSSSDQVPGSRTYMDLVAEDDDDDDDYYDDSGAGKDLEQVYAEHEGFRKYLKPIEVPKKSNRYYVNSGICRDESKMVYEKVDQFGNNLNAAYEELNLSTMYENPIYIEK